MNLESTINYKLAPILILAYKRPDMLSQLLSSLPLDRRIFIHIDGASDATNADVQETRRVASLY